MRAVVGLERRAHAVDLHLAGVAYLPLDPLPGIITGEPPAEQGLEQRLPNSPDLGSSNPVALRPAVLSVAAVTPGVLRLTLRGAGDDAGTAWPAVPDDAAAGMLVDDRPSDSPLEVVEAVDGMLELRTASLTLRVRRRPFAFELLDRAGGVLTRSGGDRRQVAGFPLTAAMAWEAGEGPDWCSVSFELVPGELVAGLGEHFGSLVHNGRRLELVADDAFGSGTGDVYKAVPLLHSSAGWSAFVHTPGPLAADVGARHPGVLELVAEEPRLDLWLIGGTGLKERLGAYTALTGRMPVVPRWALGIWMSRCRYRTRAELEAAAAGMRAHRVPCDLVHIDPDWLERDRLNCDFAWSDDKYPDPEGMVAGLRRDGFRVSVWELPYLDPESPLHEEAEAAGYLVRRADGTLAAASRAFARDGRPRALVDFSNPAARAWWQELNRRLVHLGVSVLECDFGEGLPDDARMADGRSGRSWRNLYPLWYNRCVAEVLEAGAGEDGSMILGRSGWAGSQRYPAQWGGDPEASVAGLAASLRAGLGWSLSAPGLWAHDIGGFYGDGPSPGLYIRWAQVGCLSPLARFHGLTPREPWEMGEPALDIVRDFAELRYRLLPYLESAVHEAARSGCPVMRPLALEHPEVPALWRVEHEWLLGPDLLVVAVLDDRLEPVAVEVHLPPGRWVDYWTGEARDGPASFVEVVPIERVPLYVRAGAVIPMGPIGACSDQIPAGAWELHAFPGPARITEVRGPHGTARYLPVASIGEAIAAVAADEPVPLATGAVVHEPGWERSVELVAWT
ncbi:MAG: alpha-xylosidase [Actinomycetota bacterium]|nr:alpha-xylosidase [Actinomycetota bacterium]